MRIEVVQFGLCVGLVLGAQGMLRAGDLNPPPGPIMPTMKDLATVEPRIPIMLSTTPGDADSLFKISSPGSYYLRGNVTGVAGKSGIEIEASDVTLDLMGFELIGVPGSFDGIRVSVSAGAVSGIAVFNGSARNWANRGINMSVATGTRLTSLHASGNGTDGMSAGNNGVVSMCTAYQNGGTGIFVFSHGSITHCAAESNGSNGIYAGYGSTITNCLGYDNAFAGIHTESSCTIANCTASSNTGYGFGGGTSSSLSNCTAVLNLEGGFNIGGGTTITDCSAAGNNGDCIRVSGDCIVRGNNCVNNGFFPGDGACIHATGSDNRIEGNNCTRNRRGIDVDSSGNFITRNTCTGNNTNWDVVAGNVCLVVNGAVSPIILGDTGGVAPGSTDPNANFTY